MCRLSPNGGIICGMTADNSPRAHPHAPVTPEAPPPGRDVSIPGPARQSARADSRVVGCHTALRSPNATDYYRMAFKTFL